jgi:hypothetical protein
MTLISWCGHSAALGVADGCGNHHGLWHSKKQAADGGICNLQALCRGTGSGFQRIYSRQVLVHMLQLFEPSSTKL